MHSRFNCNTTVIIQFECTKFFDNDSYLPRRHLRSQVRGGLQRTRCVVLVHDYFDQLYPPRIGEFVVVEKFVEL